MWNRIVDQLTVSAWIWRKADQASYACVLSRQMGTGSRDQFFVGFKGNTLWCAVEGPGGRRFLEDGSAVPNREWIHLALTYDGSMARLYRDGKEIQSGPMRGALGDEINPVIIGANENGPGAPNEPFHGRIARVRIYARALAPAEIARMISRDR